MPLWKDYQQPTSIESALKSMADAPGPMAVIAGGTDLLLEMQQGRHAPINTLVDITNIPEMRGVRVDDAFLYIGAAVTHSEIVQNRLIQEHAQCVIEGCGLIGGPQVRNVGTIGGNVAHALPAGDGTISMLALGSEAQLAYPDGREWMPLENLFAGPGKAAFDRSRTLVVGFRIPLRRLGEASAFYRVMRPQGVAIAIMNMAGWLRRGMDGQISDVRISMGPAGTRPFRAHKTEDYLHGKAFNDDTLTQAAKVLDTEVQLRTSPHRATSEYRHQLAPVMLKKVLTTAFKRTF